MEEEFGALVFPEFVGEGEDDDGGCGGSVEDVGEAAFEVEGFVEGSDGALGEEKDGVAGVEETGCLGAGAERVSGGFAVDGEGSDAAEEGVCADLFFVDHDTEGGVVAVGEQGVVDGDAVPEGEVVGEVEGGWGRGVGCGGKPVAVGAEGVEMLAERVGAVTVPPGLDESVRLLGEHGIG